MSGSILVVRIVVTMVNTYNSWRTGDQIMGSKGRCRWGMGWAAGVWSRERSAVEKANMIAGQWSGDLWSYASSPFLKNKSSDIGSEGRCGWGHVESQHDRRLIKRRSPCVRSRWSPKLCIIAVFKEQKIRDWKWGAMWMRTRGQDKGVQSRRPTWSSDDKAAFSMRA